MNTIDELIDYCKEPNPAGALLLTGEWGCGKTYLIENTLKKKLENECIVIRLSLFGVTTISEITTSLSKVWLLEWAKVAGGFSDSKALELINKLYKTVKANSASIPGKIGKAFKIDLDLSSLIEVRNEIDGKPVVLVFDDLERVKIDVVDVLGMVNDYCENKQFHTIVIANEEIIKENVNSTDSQPDNQREVHSKKSRLNYNDIKEKIIQRTLQYHPDYRVIIDEIINNTAYKGGKEYRSFLLSNKELITSLYLPNLLYSNESASFHNSSNGKTPPQNIRSLKSALQDYYRIYAILSMPKYKKTIVSDHSSDYFYAFLSYYYAYKSGLINPEELLSESRIHDFYYLYEDQYMFSSTKAWITSGEWDERSFIAEVEHWIEERKVIEPKDVIRLRRLTDIDEEVLSAGFFEYIEMAYNGELSLNEYTQLIYNSRSAREFNYCFPSPINWDRIRSGITKRIETILEGKIQESHYRSFIDPNDRNQFEDEEWKTYSIIDNYYKKGTLVHHINKKQYIETLLIYGLGSISTLRNKVYICFDKDFADATAEAYKQATNEERDTFPSLFYRMWETNMTNNDFDFNESNAGFSYFLELLERIEEDLTINRKMISAKHTNNLMQKVKQLLIKIP